MSNYLEAVKIINKSKNIYIASHISPDGDNIGSILGLYMGLKKIKNDVNIIKVDEVPDYLNFLENIDKIKDYDGREVDLFIALDCADIDRLGLGKEIALNSKYILNLDHHKSNTEYGDLNIIDPKASATCEMVYYLLKSLDIELDKEISEALYVGISTDTGSFMYDSTDYETHLIASHLLSYNIDLAKINVNLYQSKTMSQALLHIKALDTVRFYGGGKIATIKVTQSILGKANAKMEEAEGLVEFIRSIDIVEVAILLKEKAENEIKVSCRSKTYVDVSAAMKEFGGGGHIRAAGVTLNTSIDQAEDLLIKSLEKVI